MRRRSGAEVRAHERGVKEPTGAGAARQGRALRPRESAASVNDGDVSLQMNAAYFLGSWLSFRFQTANFVGGRSGENQK